MHFFWGRRKHAFLFFSPHVTGNLIALAWTRQLKLERLLFSPSSSFLLELSVHKLFWGKQKNTQISRNLETYKKSGKAVLGRQSQHPTKKPSRRRLTSKPPVHWRLLVAFHSRTRLTVPDKRRFSLRYRCFRVLQRGLHDIRLWGALFRSQPLKEA